MKSHFTLRIFTSGFGVLGSLLRDMLEAMSGSQGCAECGSENCGGECRRERPTTRPPAFAEKSKPRSKSSTNPDVVDDKDAHGDDEVVQAEEASSSGQEPPK